MQEQERVDALELGQAGRADDGRLLRTLRVDLARRHARLLLEECASPAHRQSKQHTNERAGDSGRRGGECARGTPVGCGWARSGPSVAPHLDPPRPTPPAPPYTLVPPACARSHILVLATRNPPRYTPYTQHPKYRRLCERSCCRPVQRQPCTNACAALLHATVHQYRPTARVRARRVTPPVARLRACFARASPQRAPCHIKPRHLLGACTPWLTGCTGARRPFRRS